MTTWGMAGIAGMAGIGGKQAKMRRNVNPKDQFGRKWGTAYEIITGEATGGWVPAWGQYGDPLRHTQAYLAMGRNEDGQVEPTRCVIDFALWIQDIEQAERQWYHQLHQVAIAKYTVIDPATVGTLDQDKFLVDQTGPKPFPSSEVLKRAQAGYAPFLGTAPLSAKDREDLKLRTLEDLKQGPATQELERKAAVGASDLPPDSYAEFLKWSFARNPKTTMKEVAAEWVQHRDALTGAA